MAALDDGEKCFKHVFSVSYPNNGLRVSKARRHGDTEEHLSFPKLHAQMFSWLQMGGSRPVQGDVAADRTQAIY